MSHYNSADRAISITTDGQRASRFDLRSSTHGYPLGHEHRRSMVSPIDPTDYQRALNSMQNYNDFGGGDAWTYAPDPARTSLETLWSRPPATNISAASAAAASSPADVTGVTGAHSLHRHAAQQPSANGSIGNGTRVAAHVGSGSSPVSPFAQRVPAAATPTFVQLGGRPPADNDATPSSAYALYSTDYTHDDLSAADPLVLANSNHHQAGLPQSAIPATLHHAHAHTHALPPGPLDVTFGATRAAAISQSTYKQNQARSTLWWGELEPWMDEEYAKQVCDLMGWEQAQVKVPHSTTDPSTGQTGNNPGYCFLSFPTPQHAAAVLAQINSAPSGTQLMPNSNKPFVLNWASSPSPSPATPSYQPQTPTMITGNASQQQQKEYSIFVGDLAPETSNSDLVAVFRNPVLGLRNDRAPKFIRPFYSCKSAKIMLDPVTGVSRGYGFVRFTEEADQQRALIEMHGLYCLSRPMRISPATAKFKALANGSNGPGPGGFENNSVIDAAAHIFSGGDSLAASRSSSSVGSSSSMPSLTTSSTASSMSAGNQTGLSSLEALAQLIAQAGLADPEKAGTRPFPSITAPLVTDQAKLDESWKHQAQARAILGNLIGPNGEQLTSTDPYNTTVFVGGLSPLISEETLRTFFAPFGDIHYVKVPAGKHCGFVQFVKKADAERAIERMQGFLIAGSRIRLSWGRSQYKAAQAAAQAAATAQAQAHNTDISRTVNGSLQVTSEQALELLQKLGIAPLIGNTLAGAQQPPDLGSQEPLSRPATNPNESAHGNQYENAYAASPLQSRFGVSDVMGNRVPGFSPFSPDPNYLANMMTERERPASVDTSDIMSRILNGNPQRFGNIGNLGASSSGTENAPNVSSNADRFSPTSSHSSARSATPSQKPDAFGFSFSRGAPPVAQGRASARSGADATAGQSDPEGIQDLNYTLASLDLEADRGMLHAGHSSSDFSESSSGSVQFKLSQDSGSPTA